MKVNDIFLIEAGIIDRLKRTFGKKSSKPTRRSTSKTSAPAANTWSPMFGKNAPQKSSTGGAVTKTSGGTIHTASPTNPNQPKTPANAPASAVATPAAGTATTDEIPARAGTTSASMGLDQRRLARSIIITLDEIDDPQLLLNIKRKLDSKVKV